MGSAQLGTSALCSISEFGMNCRPGDLLGVYLDLEYYGRLAKLHNLLRLFAF